MHIVISQHTVDQCVTTAFSTISPLEFQAILISELKNFFKLEKIGLATLQKESDKLVLYIGSLHSPRRFSLSIEKSDLGLLEAGSSWKTTGRFDIKDNLYLEMREHSKKDSLIPTERTKVFPLIDRV